MISDCWISRPALIFHYFPRWEIFVYSAGPEWLSWQLLDMYGQKSAIMAETEGGKVTKETKCLLPCSFMEYKVNIKLPFNLFVYQFP